MNNYFKGKVVIVTGSSRGVGYATAKNLLILGAKVVLTARGTERLEKSRQSLSTLGEVIAVPGDIGSYEDAKNILEQTLAHFSRIDILINNAGISMRGTFENLQTKVIQDIVGTNLLGSIYLSNLAIPYLKESDGQIIFISSIAGLLGLPNASAYCATKFALKGLSESLRIELHPYGIHVGIVYLGFTEHDPEKRLVASNGDLLKPDRPAHHTQAQAAHLILKMISKRNRSLTMTPIGKLALLISRLCPALVELIVKVARENNWKIYQKLS